MPTAMFAAVPRTPPPPKESPDFGVGINSALLNSSMLTRMFASPDIPDDNPLSDTDTSLFDYDRRNVESVEHGYVVNDGQVSILCAYTCSLPIYLFTTSNNSISRI